MIRRVAALLVALVALLAASGCHEIQNPGIRSLPLVFGARVTTGQLKVWTGEPCLGVTRFGLIFEGDTRAELELQASADQGVQVDHVTLGGPYPPGLEITKPLPAGFDWHTAKSIRISITASIEGGGTAMDMAEIVNGSAEHPDDTYWFGEAGWLNPTELAAKDGKTLLTPCMPDPAKK